MPHHFFSRIDTKPENIHILNGNAEDLDAECAAYEDKIVAAGGIDLFLGGRWGGRPQCLQRACVKPRLPDGGQDAGHGHDTGEFVVLWWGCVQGSADGLGWRSDYYGCEFKRSPVWRKIPGEREDANDILKEITQAREVVIIALGASKSVVLQKAIEGGVNHTWTLSCLQNHPYSMIVADEDATLELQVKTAKYFKSIEQVGYTRSFDQTLPPRLWTWSLTSPPQTPRERKWSVEEHLVELTPDSMTSRMHDWTGA